MTIKLQKNIDSEVGQLKAEVAALRSFVIGVAGRDAEGAYRPEFVHKILRNSNEKPVAYFESSEQFLDLVNNPEA